MRSVLPLTHLKAVLQSHCQALAFLQASSNGTWLHDIALHRLTSGLTHETPLALPGAPYRHTFFRLSALPWRQLAKQLAKQLSNSLIPNAWWRWLAGNHAAPCHGTKQLPAHAGGWTIGPSACPQCAYSGSWIPTYPNGFQELLWQLSLSGPSLYPLATLQHLRCISTTCCFHHTSVTAHGSGPAGNTEWEQCQRILHPAYW